jgi:hypothetical protein
VVHHPLGEVLGEACLALLGVGCLLVDDPVGLGEGVGEPCGRLVHVLFVSSVHHVPGSFPSGFPTPSFLPQGEEKYARAVVRVETPQ